MPIQLIVGLANPGDNYYPTRHNAGEWFVEQLLRDTPDNLALESKFFARITQTLLYNKPVRIMIPTTYMNDSGKAVAAAASFYKISPEDILIVHDEIDLPPGTVKLKLGGGHGGHNGLRHIIQALGTPHFHRLRIGVGHPGNKDDVVDYVLKKPKSDEKRLIDDAIISALQVMPTVMSDDMQAAMKTLHTGVNDGI